MAELNKELDITITVKGDNEITSYPWWLIIDPKQMMSPNCHTVSSMVSGPFFSRKEAQDHLDARRYNFSRRAVVYCASGHMTTEYKRAFDSAKNKES